MSVPMPSILRSGAQTSTRWVAVALLIGTSALALGGFSAWAWGQQVQREAAQQQWDTDTANHRDCVSAAATRDNTIALERADDDRDERFLDLIEGIVSLGRTDSPIVIGALAKVDAERDQLAADRAEFDELRPALDPRLCPPAPAGPRP
jgi:hypothetical protein